MHFILNSFFRFLDTAFSGSHSNSQDRKKTDPEHDVVPHCEGNQIPDFILLLSPRRVPAQSESCESS